MTEGLGPTTVRSSTIDNNTATAVLRFEGRTWVLNTAVFFPAIQFLDVLFYTQFQGASQAAYKFAEMQHEQHQVRLVAAVPPSGTAHPVQWYCLAVPPLAAVHEAEQHLPWVV